MTGHRDVCPDCGRLLPADDFSSVRCLDCQRQLDSARWPTSPLGRVLERRAVLATIDEHDPRHPQP